MIETTCAPGVGRPAPPRWEWRCFGADLAELGQRIGPAAQLPSHGSEELYLAHARSPHNAKIRDALLDVKRLQATAASGLELWDVQMQRAFSLAAPDILAFFEAMDMAPPALRSDSYAQQAFLDDVINRDPGFRAVPVKKSRRSFLLDGLRAEIARLEVAGSKHVSFCAADERPERVEAALRELGLDPTANIGFPKFLKSFRLLDANS